MSYTSYKKFIKAFDFPNPNWDNLPVDFPDCDVSGLTKEQKCLFDAIKLAWLTGTPAGRRKIKKASAFLTISLMCLIGLISLIRLTLTGSQSQFTKPVSAATVSATLKRIPTIDEIVESTMSAIFK